ncbi:hypothetical protein Xbud_03793 [Xenorhabdus budapestensis]|uniref:Uncharacterized protein n=1 Tax=Xenorhabdus budapestensis TaxID=290110 RepID=A0A2D0IKC4_XENBU|nr:hypothetical protein Xbud_03793 [Xenorhabdus budapestensis]
MATHWVYCDVLAIQSVTGIFWYDFFLAGTRRFSQPDDDENGAAIFIRGIYSEPAVVKSRTNDLRRAGTGVSMDFCEQWFYALDTGAAAISA